MVLDSSLDSIHSNVFEEIKWSSKPTKIAKKNKKKVEAAEKN